MNRNDRALPRIATRPTPGAKHDLFAIEQTAKMLGVPLMPWQRFVARVASERLPGNPKKFRYSKIMLTVPRQAGKTTLMRAVLAQRAIMEKRRKAFYTAQTGKDATERWKDLIRQIEDCPLSSYTTTRLSQGSQTLAFSNGSTISPFAPTPKSLHGYTPDDVMLDEIFNWSQEEGNLLMGAVKPAQVTRVGKQLWLVSTMGTDDSEFLNGEISAGREAVDNPDSSTAYFEWALAPGLDAMDPSNWGFHPALGHTITIADIEDARDSMKDNPAEFERAYMNRRTRVASKWVEDDVLAKIMTWFDEDLRPGATRLHFAWDSDPKDGGGAAIVAAWKRDDGKISVMPWLSDTTKSFVQDELKDIRRTLGVRNIAYDETAINRYTAGQDTRTAGDTISTKEYVTACMMLQRLIESGEVVMQASEPLKLAIQSVVTSPLGEGWKISRSKSSGDVSLAVATAIAVMRASHERVSSGPKIRF